MMSPANHVVRASLCLGFATAIFGLLAILLPTTSSAQPPGDLAQDHAVLDLLPPPPDPDCAVEWDGNQRRVSSFQRDAVAGYVTNHGVSNYDTDLVLDYDTVHEASDQQRSIIVGATYNDGFDADNPDASLSVSSQFFTAVKSYMHLDDAQPAPEGFSYAQIQWDQPVEVQGGDAVVHFDSALLETAFEGGLVYVGDAYAVFYIVDLGDNLVHQTSIFNHQATGETWPGTGAIVREIDVPLDPGRYRVGVALQTFVGADGPGLGRAVNYLDLIGAWKVLCATPEPAPLQNPASVPTRVAARSQE